MCKRITVNSIMDEKCLNFMKLLKLHAVHVLVIFFKNEKKLEGENQSVGNLSRNREYDIV